MVSIRWPADNSHDIVYSNAGVAGMHVSKSLLFPRTHIPNALSPTSHSEICFSEYFVSPPPLRKFSYNATS